MVHLTLCAWHCDMKFTSSKLEFNIKVKGNWHDHPLESNSKYCEQCNENNVGIITILNKTDNGDYSSLIGNKNLIWIQGNIISKEKIYENNDNINGYEIIECDNYEILQKLNIPLIGNVLYIVGSNMIPSKLYNIETNTIDYFYGINNFMHNSDPKGYITLSHSWMMSLKIDNKHICKFCFNDGEYEYCFSRLVNNIITVAKKDNIKYLWLDSLCVEQQLCYSKCLELSSMYNYYLNASKTIAVLTLDEIKENKTTEISQKIGWEFVLKSLKKCDDKYVSERMEKIKLIFNNPWFTRGWTFQEALSNSEVYLIYHGDIIYLDYLLEEYKTFNYKFNTKNIYKADKLFKMYDLTLSKTFGQSVESYENRQTKIKSDSLLCLTGLSGINRILPDNYPYLDYEKLKDIVLNILFDNGDNSLLLLDKIDDQVVNQTNCDYGILDGLNIKLLNTNTCSFKGSQWVDSSIEKIYKFNNLQELIIWILSNKHVCKTLFDKNELTIINRITTIDEKYLSGVISKNIFEGIFEGNFVSDLGFLVNKCSNKSLYIWKCNKDHYLWGVNTKHKKLKLSIKEKHTISICISNNNKYSGLGWSYYHESTNNFVNDFIITDIIRVL